MEKLSVFVTTFNNAATLDACLRSVTWADEVVVLDSFSTDATLEVANTHGCRVFQHEFLGYGRQKQLALEKTTHPWVLLLDADEMLSPELAEEIRELLIRGPRAAGYAIPRREQIFWRMNHPWVRLNAHLRLFDKRRGRVGDTPVHAAPEVDGHVERLRHAFYHFGEVDIHSKVEKVNAYSTGLVRDKAAKGRRVRPWTLLFYPPWVFVQTYLFKRAFLDGWAGFIASVVMSFYAFLKYAKLHEHRELERLGTSRLPPGAPSTRVARDEAGRATQGKPADA